MERSVSTPCTFKPNTTYQAILSIKDGKTSLALVMSMKTVQAGVSTAVMSCEVDSGAKWLSMKFKSNASKGPAQIKQNAQLEAQQNALRQLGFAVLGQAFKDANTPKIELPRGHHRSKWYWYPLPARH